MRDISLILKATYSKHRILDFVRFFTKYVSMKRLILLLLLANFAVVTHAQLIPYQNGLKWGYADENQSIQIAATYDQANLFKNYFLDIFKDTTWLEAYYAEVYEDGKWKAIREDGTLIAPFTSSVGTPLKDDLIILHGRLMNKHLKAFSKFGLQVLPPYQASKGNYLHRATINTILGTPDTYHHNNSSDFLVVQNGKYKGIINYEGDEILPTLYHHISNITTDGKVLIHHPAYVEQGDESKKSTVLYDLNTKFVKTFPQFPYLSTSSEIREGLVNVNLNAEKRSGDEYAYFDLEGNVVITLKEKNAAGRPFRNGKALIRESEGKWRVIGRTGTTLMRLENGEKLIRFRDFFFLKEADGKWYMYDLALNKMDFLAFDELPEIIFCREGWFSGLRKGKYGVFTTKREIVQPFKFQRAINTYSFCNTKHRDSTLITLYSYDGKATLYDENLKRLVKDSFEYILPINQRKGIYKASKAGVKGVLFYKAGESRFIGGFEDVHANSPHFNNPSFDSLIVRKNNLYGSMDELGNLVLPCIFPHDFIWNETIEKDKIYFASNEDAIHIIKSGKVYSLSKPLKQSFGRDFDLMRRFNAPAGNNFQVQVSPYIMVESNGYFNILDANTFKLLFDFEHHALQLSKTGLAIGARKEIREIIDLSSGAVLFDTIAVTVNESREGGLYNIIDYLGDKNIATIYNPSTGIMKKADFVALGSARDTLLAVKSLKTNRCGYIDPVTFEVRIPLKFSDADAFKNGLAKVKRTKKGLGREEVYTGVVDKHGKIIVPLQYKNIKIYSNHLIVASSSRHGDIFYDGENIYSSTNPTMNVEILKDGYWLVDNTIYEQNEVVLEGVSHVKMGKKHIWFFKDGVFQNLAQDKKVSYDFEFDQCQIIEKGAIKICHFGHLQDYEFHMGHYATVLNNDNQTLIPIGTGQIKYVERGNCFLVTQNGRTAIFDLSGKRLTDFKYQTVRTVAQDNIVRVWTSDRQGYYVSTLTGREFVD